MDRSRESSQKVGPGSWPSLLMPFRMMESSAAWHFFFWVGWVEGTVSAREGEGRELAALFGA